MKKDAKQRTSYKIGGVRAASYVTGPDGQVLTQASLPSATTGRWVARRKAEVIVAVRGGLLNLSEACDRYQISNEEYVAWDRAYEKRGLSGLRACRRSNPIDRTAAPEKI